jgi:hypothetical protein
MSDRSTPAARDLYHGHLRDCRECRRMHRLLYALYEGPIVPPAPGGVGEERQFHAALRRSREEAPQPWYHKLSMRAGIVALAGSAAVLALALFDVGPVKDFAELGSSDPTTAQATPSDASMPSTPDAGGINHQAQSYGRIVGGHARVTTPDGAPPTDTFPVGTRFELERSEALQVGLVGKLVANFTPGSSLAWTAASPSLIEVELDRGIAAVRYDRRPSDPILQVRTPTAVVRVVGTVFTVQVEDGGNTRVSVLRGQVEVLDPASNRQIAEVESGNWFDVASSSFGNVGRVEVAAALPLSNDVAEAGADPHDMVALADGRIPDTWNVPGLPADPDLRRLEYVPASSDDPPAYELDMQVARAATTGDHGRGSTHVGAPSVPRKVQDDGEDIIEHLMRDAEATRRKEMRAAMETCRSHYDSPERRYRAAKCLSRFVSKYGNDPAAAEGYLLVGMLRMDYALDYRAAEKAFETFLRRAPSHTYAELAYYRMWLAAVEDGRISVALQRAHGYLERYPNGKYVGKMLQRFPELKSEL